MENAAFPSGDGMAVSPVAYPGGICRVLAVDEDQSHLASLTQMLQRHGYAVTAKTSPEEGLRALRENPEGFNLVMSVAHTQGAGIDGFGLLRHAKENYPVVLFTDNGVETVMRAIVEGAYDCLTKPLQDQDIRHIWQHVLHRQLDTASGAAAANADDPSSNVAIHQGDMARKRGFEGQDDSDDGGSDGSQQQKQGRTTKKANINSPPQQLRGTEDYSPGGMRNILEVQGLQVTAQQVINHSEKYRRDCLTNHLLAMPTASSCHSDMSMNYLRPGSSGLYMRPQGAINIGQTRLLNNGASPVGCGILGSQSYRPSYVGITGHGNRHGNANANCNGNATANGFHNGGRGGVLVNDMASVLLWSTLAQQGYMFSASLPSNLAQAVQQAMPTNRLSPSSPICTNDNPNPIWQHAFPRESPLRYDGSTGGISMLPLPMDLPMDDGEDLLRSYLEGEDEVMQNPATEGMTQIIHGDSASGQIIATQPQELSDLCWESTYGNGTAGPSGGSAVMTMDWELTEDEMEKVFNCQDDGPSKKRYPYDSSDVEFDDPYAPLGSDASDESFDSKESDTEVENWNVKSFTRKAEEKLLAQGISAYLGANGEYKCPFHRVKPRDGLRDSLLMHVQALAREAADLRVRAEHQALLNVLNF